MQFTTSLLSLLGLAASVTALPSEKRQNGERIYAKYYSDNGCGGIWRDDTVWVQNRDGTCIDVNNPFQYNSTLIADNLATLKCKSTKFEVIPVTKERGLTSGFPPSSACL